MKTNPWLYAVAGAGALFLAACGSSNSDGDDDVVVPPPTTEPSVISCIGNDCTINTGRLTQSYTLTAARNWKLNGVLTVGYGNDFITDNTNAAAIKAAGVTLTIEPGVHVQASNSSAVLLITRGSKINAVGTVTNPITFSSLDAGFDGMSEWGGVIVQGFAPQYGKGNTGVCYTAGNTFCNVEGEGGPFVGKFGGSDVADNSGTIKYVRIAEGGIPFTPNNEVNGLTLMGVGSGTTIDYVQVHSNLDDGVEWFGGTVNVKHLVLTNNDDDDIDFDEGYKGNIQFAIIRKNQTPGASPSGQNDPRGIEANSSDATYVPQTEAVLSNITIIGGPVNNFAGKLQPGVLARGAVKMTLVNSAVQGFDTGCIRIDHAAVTASITVNSDVTLTNVPGNCPTGTATKYYANGNTANPASTPNSTGTVFTLDTATYAISGGMLGAAVTPVPVGTSGFTFTPTNYIGAVAPGTAPADLWWKTWTITGSL